jgi:hypothetical protein
MINADYATIFSNLSLDKINAMEIRILKIFDFSVEITLQEFEKMTKTIKDLNLAANAMKIQLAGPPSSLSARGGGCLSISGRLALKQTRPLQQLGDEEDEESSHFRNYGPVLGQKESEKEFCSYSDSRSPHTPVLTPTATDDAISFSLNSLALFREALPSQDSRDLGVASLNETLERIHEDETPLDDRTSPTPAPVHRRRSSLQIVLDNALFVIGKYLPGQLHHTAKVHVTDENLPVQTLNPTR